MADYSIFVIGESQLTISIAQGLDGITQGDGSHLVGQTITIDSRSATEVFISDNGSDTDFSDNDGNQVLNGDQTIDGIVFSDGTVVEAEYGITLTDGTNTYQAVAFNVNNSSPAYGTVEGIAFIGGPGGFPPAGVPLTVIGAQEGPSFNENQYVTPICYGSGTLIETDKGRLPIETLQCGDLIWTKDDGYLPVRWVGSQDVIASGHFRLVDIPIGVLSNSAPLRVSQQHRILVAHPLAELHYMASEVFVPAISFVDAGLATLTEDRTARYHHFLLDRHSVIEANGAASESLLATASTDASDPDSLFFPDLSGVQLEKMDTARLVLRRREATFLLRKILSIDPESSLIHTPPQTERGDRPVRAGKKEARV
ncbi:MAG: Hint domain-containing protein [Ruegeria sp.]